MKQIFKTLRSRDGFRTKTATPKAPARPTRDVLAYAAALEILG